MRWPCLPNAAVVRAIRVGLLRLSHEVGFVFRLCLAPVPSAWYWVASVPASPPICPWGVSTPPRKRPGCCFFEFEITGKLMYFSCALDGEILSAHWLLCNSLCLPFMSYHLKKVICTLGKIIILFPIENILFHLFFLGFFFLGFIPSPWNIRYLILDCLKRNAIILGEMSSEHVPVVELWSLIIWGKLTRGSGCLFA